jgi:glycosyltransferase involved in cell wall biosynthesis
VNVALMTNLFPPVQTGTAIWAREVATALARAGDRVVVITCGTAARLVVEDLDGVVVYRLPAVGHLPRREVFFNFDQFYLMWSPANLRRVMAILRAHQVDVVHQCSHILDSILLSVGACRRLDLPSVCSLHTKLGHPGHRLYDTLFKAIDRSVLAALMRSFDLVISGDVGSLAWAQGRYGVKNVGLVPLSLDAAILREPPAQPGRSGEVRILSVGHLTEMRNRRELLAALATLQGAGRAARLTVAGKVLFDGAQAMIDEYGLTDRVDLVGEVPRGQPLFDLFRAAHFEAHWLHSPGVGTATLEAMAVGLPAVTYAYHGIYGDVPFRHGENIMFVDPARPDTVLDAVRALAEDPALRARIGRNARQLVQDYLTWDRTISTLRQFYARVQR